MPLVVRQPGALRTLEAVRALAAELIEREQAAAAARGEADDISCTKGCTACCHQAVPVGSTEVAAIRRAIDTLPTEARERVLRRVRTAASRARTNGVAELPEAEPDVRRDFSRRYFEAQIACPMLEDGTCVLRDVRPLVCRDYLVTSDPEHCRQLDPEQVVRVRLGRDVVRGFARFEAQYGRTGDQLLVTALADTPPPVRAIEPLTLGAAMSHLTAT